MQIKSLEVVSIFPAASRIFNDVKIDYCCGGHDTLGEALKEKGIDHINL